MPYANYWIQLLPPLIVVDKIIPLGCYKMVHICCSVRGSPWVMTICSIMVQRYNSIEWGRLWGGTLGALTHIVCLQWLWLWSGCSGDHLVVLTSEWAMITWLQFLMLLVGFPQSQWGSCREIRSHSPCSHFFCHLLSHSPCLPVIPIFSCLKTMQTWDYDSNQICWDFYHLAMGSHDITLYNHIA